MDSPQPQGWRNARTISTVALTTYWLALFIGTHVPLSPIPTDVGVDDKTQHYLAYAGLAFLASWWIAIRRPFTTREGLKVLAAIALYGAADELLQSLVGRVTDILDWRADMVGAATGLIAFAVARRIYRRKNCDSPATEPASVEE